MFIYQEVENKCKKFKDKNAWYAYPWHSDPGGIVFPGEVVNLIHKSFLKKPYEKLNISEKEKINSKIKNLFLSEYKKIGLSNLIVFLPQVIIPDIGMDIDYEELETKLKIPDEAIDSLHIFEAAICGYLKDKNIVVHGIVYGSPLHNMLNEFVGD